MSVLTTFQGKAQTFLAAYAYGWAREEVPAFDLAQVRALATFLTCLQDPYLTWSRGNKERYCGYYTRLFRFDSQPSTVLPEYVVNLLGESASVAWSQIIGYPNQNPALVAYITSLITQGGGGRFAQDIPVSLAGGKTLGKYLNGQTIPSAGKTTEEVIRLLAIESIYPTYTPAVLSLAQSVPTDGEVGESLSNTLTATFSRGDAGALTQLQIQQGTTLIGSTGSTSPLVRTLGVVRTLSTQTFRALATYAAGLPKLVTPGNTPDDRTPLVGSPNAPQAAQAGLVSNQTSVGGHYKLFWGPVATVPTTPAGVRSLPQSQLTSQGNAAVLNTGTTYATFLIYLPPGKALVNVTDLDNVNANITSAYVPQTPVAVNDAGATPVSGYTPYLYQAAGPQPSSFRHQFTFQ